MAKPDRETEGVLKTLAQVKPLTSGDPDISVVRQAYDEVFAAWTAPTLKPTQERWTQAASPESRPCLVIEPAQASNNPFTLVFIHGGGWSLGTAISYAPLGRWLCAKTGMRVLVPDFPQAPEEPAPAARLALERTLSWAAEKFGDPVILAGDSAGGNLAAVLANHPPQYVSIAAQVLLYPVLDLRPDASYPSRRKYGRGRHFLTEAAILGAAMQYCGESESPASPLLSPILETDFSHTPQTVLLVSELDPLLDECLAYADQLKQRGLSVDVIIARRTIHGFGSFCGRISSGRKALESACDFLMKICSS